MSMFEVTGQVVHVFDAPEMVNKETGEVTRESRPKVQLIGDIPLQNGQARYDLVTLSADTKEEWDLLKGQRVAVPLGMFAPSKNNIVYFIPKGCHPRPLEGLGGAQ